MQVLLHGVYHVDRFLSTQSVAKESLQLVGAVALMLASNNFCKLPAQDGERLEGERGLTSAEDITYWTDSTYTSDEVLHMEETRPTSSVLDDRFRAGQCCAAVYAWLRRLFGLPEAGRSQRKGGKARWQPLWERRRRGLVKERIVSEQEDQAARIKELEEHVSWLEYELATARGVHAAALQPLPERPDTLEFSAGRSTTVDSHAHGWSLLPRTTAR